MGCWVVCLMAGVQNALWLGPASAGAGAGGEWMGCGMALLLAGFASKTLLGWGQQVPEL